jgi:hypothetical protein
LHLEEKLFPQAEARVKMIEDAIAKGMFDFWVECQHTGRINGER